jgi:DNA repair exonuclease SbcCD nuclease subunit
MTFKFLHAADLHLDSPLLGLGSKSADYATRIDRASREAFEALVALAIGEECSFVVLAGDLFDGDLRNFQTGLFFIDQMRRLEDAKIQAFIILGNHDAENRFAAKLSLSHNVHVFASRCAESVSIEALAVTVHGRSFPQRDVSENIARDYPAPVAGQFNIGVLHTACQGSESYHALYAPCTLEQLVNHGYDYWALGHVHGRVVLHEQPHIVYPGNLQGRNARETGPKGATIVTVTDGRVTDLAHHDLDVVRWLQLEIDASAAQSRAALLDVVRAALNEACEDAGERGLAVRLRLCGETSQHNRLVLEQQAFWEDVAILAATLTGDIWLEKLIVATTAPAVPEAVDPTVSGRLMSEIEGSGSDETISNLAQARIAEIRAKMPAGAHAEDFFEVLRGEVAERARALALSLIKDTEAGDAAH